MSKWLHFTDLLPTTFNLSCNQHAKRFSDIGISALTVPVFCLPLFFPPLRIFCLDGHKVAPAVVHNDTGEEPVTVGIGSGYKGKVDCIGGTPVAAKLIDTTMSVHCHHDALAAGVEVTEKVLPGKCGNNIGTPNAHYSHPGVQLLGMCVNTVNLRLSCNVMKG